MNAYGTEVTLGDGSAILLGAASAAIELAQGRFATTRVVEGRDVVANLFGLGLGITAAACCYLAWSALAGLGRMMIAATDKR